MRTFPMLLVFLAVTGCNNHRPISEADRRKYFGDPFIYIGAPFCCIYLGLDTNEAARFETNFWRFAGQHDIHKPEKHYRTYSGPPLVTCKSDHVSVYAGYTWTTNVLQGARTTDVLAEWAKISWQPALFGNADWPTNACRIAKNGHEVLAPMTGFVKMASNDTNYPVQDFKQLSESLTAALQSAFPDRSVRVYAYDGEKR